MTNNLTPEVMELYAAIGRGEVVERWNGIGGSPWVQWWPYDNTTLGDPRWHWRIKPRIDGLMECVERFGAAKFFDGADCGGNDDEVDAARDAVRAYAEAMLPQWMDIASAPKDGTHILVSAGDRVSIGGWLSDINQGAEWEGQIGMAGWWAVDLGPHNDKPTHWMPMPPPPTDSTKGN